MVRHLDHHTHLREWARSKLWWLLFVRNWNERRYLPLAFLWWGWFSGVSGSRECEVHRGHAFGYLGQKNGVQELVPIAMVAAMDGAQCVDALRQLYSVQASNAKWARDRDMMHLLRCLFFYSAHFKFTCHQHMCKH